MSGRRERGKEESERDGGKGRETGEVRVERLKSQSGSDTTNQRGWASCKLVGLRAVVETCSPQENCDSAGHEPEGEGRSRDIT